MPHPSTSSDARPARDIGEGDRPRGRDQAGTREHQGHRTSSRRSSFLPPATVANRLSQATSTNDPPPAVCLSRSVAAEPDAVLQIHGLRARSGLDGHVHPARKTRDEDVVELGPAVTGVTVDLDTVDADGGELCAGELTAVEHEEDLVALALARRPVDDEEPAEGQRRAEFFEDLAAQRRGGGLPRHEVSAGQIPAVLVGRVHEQY